MADGALALAIPVRHPIWVLTYASRDITADITGMVTEVSYSDTSGAHDYHRGRRLRGETDDLQVTLEDRERLWQGPWFPVRGDILSLQVGYEGEELLNCGDFQVDELELSGPPDTFHLRCLSAGITPSLRSPRDVRYEATDLEGNRTSNLTLMQVAETVAQRNGLTVTGAPNDINVGWRRLTQHRQTDVAFLRRLALAHDYDFTVRGTQLVFYSRKQLEQQASVTTLLRTATKNFEFRTKTQAIYKTSTVAYQDPWQKQLITAQSQAADIGIADSDILAIPQEVPTGDDLHIVVRCETPQQAQLKADSALHDANMVEVTGRIETEGAVLLVAGVNIDISGFAAFDGQYHIDASRHRLDRSGGYTTEIEVRKLQ